MNTDKFASNAIVTDPASVGFSVQEISDILFKKFSWRATTSSQIPYWKESIYKPLIYPAQIFGDEIPETPPVDFVTLTNEQIISLFGIQAEELSLFNTTVDGVPTFQIEQSVAYPYILRVTKLRLQPVMGNPDFAFSAITPNTNVNLLATPIHFNMFKNAYRGTFYRTTGPSGEIGFSGYDEIKETQFSYVFDTDNGIFTSYEVENVQFYPNSIRRTRPPAVTCYVYRGTFGFSKFLSSGVTSIQVEGSGSVTGEVTFAAGNNIEIITSTNTIIISAEGSSNTWNDVGVSSAIYYNAGPVIVGASTIIDPAYAFATNGTLFATTVLTESVYTTSDKHLKENIKSFQSPSNILNISTVTYNYTNKAHVNEIGLIAQDVEQYVPQIVKEFNGFKSVQYDRIGVILLPIVREQQKKILELEESIRELKCITYTLIHSSK